MSVVRYLCLGLFCSLLVACQSTKIIRTDRNIVLAPGQSQQFEVHPLQDWQDSGIRVEAGQTYQLEASGMWSYGGICGVADPTGAGNSGICEGVPYVQGKSAAALVARIGDGGPPFFVGFNKTISPNVSGNLIFGPNQWDWMPTDNTGKMVVSATRAGGAPVAKVEQPASSQPQYNATSDLNVSKVLSPSMAFDGPRIALVIGNADYSVGALKNPVNDARLMTKTLRSLGFRVIHEENANQHQMKRALNKFGDFLGSAGKHAVGLLYYAGHGVQVAGENFLIPVNANIQNEKDVDVESVSVNAALSAMEFAQNDLNVIILDACRNNPFRSGFRSTTRGLALIDAPRGSLIAYSTSPGNVAADGTGLNSPYTSALAAAMTSKGVAVERMFRNVRNRVMGKTRNQQIPWEASSLIGGDFFFNP